MKVLGISGSPRSGATTDQLVQAVLNGVEGCETEFVSLSGKRIGACIACLGCTEDNVCKVKDDMAALRPKIVEADAYVIGDLPDNVSATAVSLLANAAGTAKVTVTVLITPEEVDKATKMSADYRPPGR